MTLSATGSSDPDGDELSYGWYAYPEAGTAGVIPGILNSERPEIEVTIPRETPAGSFVHIFLEVTDDGEPGLTSYRRVVLEVD